MDEEYKDESISLPNKTIVNFDEGNYSEDDINEINAFISALEQLINGKTDQNQVSELLLQFCHTMNRNHIEFERIFSDLNGINTFLYLFQNYDFLCTDLLPIALILLIKFSSNDQSQSGIAKELINTDIFNFLIDQLIQNDQNEYILDLLLILVPIHEYPEYFIDLFPIERLYFVNLDPTIVVNELKGSILPFMTFSHIYFTKFNIKPTEQSLISFAAVLNTIGANYDITEYFTDKITDFLSILLSILNNFPNLLMILNDTSELSPFYEQILDLLDNKSEEITLIAMKILNLVYSYDKTNNVSNREFSMNVYCYINLESIYSRISPTNIDLSILAIQILKHCIILNPSMLQDISDDFLVSIQTIFLEASYEIKRPLILLINRMIMLTDRLWNLISDDFIVAMIDIIDNSSSNVITALNIITVLIIKYMQHGKRREIVIKLIEFELEQAIDSLLETNPDVRTESIAEHLSSLLNPEEEEFEDE